MKTVLYIDCCIRKELSRTRRLAEAFLDCLSQLQDYTIEKICLMEEPLSLLSGDFFFQRERLLDEHRLNHPRFRYAHQFQQANPTLLNLHLNTFYDSTTTDSGGVSESTTCIVMGRVHTDEGMISHSGRT